MRFEIGGIDHQIVRFAALRGQFRQDAVEHTQPTPADEAVVDGLVRTVVGRDISPAKTIADHEQDAAQHPAVIYTRHHATKENRARSGASAPALAGQRVASHSEGTTRHWPR